MTELITRRTYLPGSWFGIFGDSATVLLPPSEKSRVPALWALIDDGESDDFGEGLEFVRAELARRRNGQNEPRVAAKTGRFALGRAQCPAHVAAGVEQIDVRKVRGGRADCPRAWFAGHNRALDRPA